MVVSEDNMWANVQPWEEPWKINYDMSIKQDWKPFFTDRFPKSKVKVATIQNDGQGGVGPRYR
jgi:coiled-coil and C2 domain-containing protein 2A